MLTVDQSRNENGLYSHKGNFGHKFGWSKWGGCKFESGWTGENTFVGTN